MEFGLSCLLGVSEEGGRSRTGQKCSRDAGLQSQLWVLWSCGGSGRTLGPLPLSVPREG